jgi:hypothetical protein
MTSTKVFFRLPVLTLLASLALATSARAQPAPRPGSETDAASPVDSSAAPATLDAVLQTIARLQLTVEEQGREIAELRRALAQNIDSARVDPLKPKTAEGQELAATGAVPVAVNPQSPAAQGDIGDQRAPETPSNIVSVGEFPGSFQIPGSDAAFKLGGLVRVNWVSTNNALNGVDDRFVTSAIPVEGTASLASGSRVDLIASPSRFNFDLRTRTGVGYMRAFIEGDFAGTNGAFRLRHAFGQWRNMLFGQTWSTYANRDAEPDGIDFEGLNAIVLFRQPQLRWTTQLREKLQISLALEDPNPDLTGATGISQVPDVIARMRYEPTSGGSVQLAGIIRQLRGTPTERPTEILGTPGYGVNISGRIVSPIISRHDWLLFQHNSGTGVGRYITDLRTLGGQDAVYNPVDNSLKTLNVFSGYIGYEHHWTDMVRSSFTFGVVDVSNQDIQPDDALHLTRRYSANIMWSPIPRMDLVIETLWGSRTNKDSKTGTAFQTQVGSTFRF